jgi:predicted enzyme related to lactoylglutathione lyase
VVKGLYAGVVAGDLERARSWYERVFGREPDAAPMGGLYEWRVGEQCVQLVALDKIREIQHLPDWGAVGSSSVTFVVDDAQMAAADAVEHGGTAVSHFENPAFRTASVGDPDGNLVTFLQQTPS